MTSCPHSLPCPIQDACQRPCVKKTGWLSGETYCATHGRSQGWPCPGHIRGHHPIAPVPWHIAEDGTVLCQTDVATRPCDACDGRGSLDGVYPDRCPVCKGAGTRPIPPAEKGQADA